MAIVRMLLLLVVAVSLISVDPALAAKKKKKKLAPGDIAYSRAQESKEYPPAIFPHWRHVPQFRCYVCHSAIFEMEQSEGVGELMHKAEKCGSCHSGKPAFDIGLTSCHRCHVRSEESNANKKKKSKSAKNKNKDKVEKVEADKEEGKDAD